MASSDTPGFDDLDPVPSGNDYEEDVPRITLDPGESIVAEIRHIERNVGQYSNTMLHLTRSDGELVKMWSNATIDRALDDADVGPGDVIGIRKDAEKYEFENEEGESGEAYGFEVRVSGGDA